ncbi:MAG: tetratricopeptide repeat protein [Odoribacter sp.]|nr:tetratricopeptide repeat protein [Odoribacter sp.]
MFGFLKSIFNNTSTEETTKEEMKEEVSEEGAINEEEKEIERKFDILKFDGLKALRIRKIPYAIRCFKEAIALKEEFETLYYLLLAYIQNDEQEEALNICSRIIELEPDHMEMYLHRANLQYGMGKIAETIEDCKTILASDENNVEALILIVKAKQQAKAHEEAINHLTLCIDINPELSEVYTLRAALYKQCEKYEEALADVNKALELNPEDEESLFRRGRIYELQHEKEKALADYEKIIHLNPFYKQAYLQKGNLIIERANIEESISFFDEAIENNPDFPEFYFERAKLKEKKGDKEGAEEDIQQGTALKEEYEEGESDTVDFNKMYSNHPL